MSKYYKYIKGWVMTAVLGSICNYIYSLKAKKPVLPWETIPGFLLFFLVMILAIMLTIYLKKHFPNHNFSTLGMVTLIGILLSLPGLSPVAGFVKASISKISLLPLCTPVLAYTGISAGKDLSTFRKQGLAIVVTTLVAFIGTYLGSAIIANITLKVMGVF